MKKLIVFDLDGTLAISKTSIDDEMAGLLSVLMAIAKVVVISGGGWPQFARQLLGPLAHDPNLDNLALLPTSGTKFYHYGGSWSPLYSEDLGAAEKSTILSALRQALTTSGDRVDRVWGDTIEDRGSQITFSALGQAAPIDEKERWDPELIKRKNIKATLDVLLPAFSVRLGGTTSIDITRPGIDKGYAIGKLRDILRIAIEDMVFIGDMLFPGGNDYPAFTAGVVSIRVRDPYDTKRLIEAIIACLGGTPPVRSGGQAVGP
jgi:hypothetical protein